MHAQADQEGEDDGADGARDPQLGTQDARGEYDGEHIDGGPGVEERSRRPDAGAARVDAGEQREDRAGAHRENRPRNRGDGVGQQLAGSRTEVSDHRLLADEHRNGAGDEERRDETEQHVLASVVVEHGEGLDESGLHAAAPYRQQVGRREHPQEHGELLRSRVHPATLPARLRGPRYG